MSARPSSPFVAVDWGTSSLRVWLLAADGAILAETRSPDGMDVVAAGGFEAMLRDRLADLGPALDDLPRPLPVVLCGMVGARQGWREAGYLDLPAEPAAVVGASIPVAAAGLDARILPGLARRDPERPDVMRGEETQLLGLLADDPGATGLVCMPGTHTKWVRLEAGTVADFATVMTGELFAVMSGHSILRHTLAGNRPSGDPAAPAFRAGLARGLADPGALVGELFALRAGGLLHGLAGADAADRLSGLLIGAEIGHTVARIGGGAAPVVLVASGPLAALYRAGLEAAGRSVRTVDADHAVRAGLTCAAAHLWPAAPAGSP